jgi:hypothetical protein
MDCVELAPVRREILERIALHKCERIARLFGDIDPNDFIEARATIANRRPARTAE